MKKIMLLVIYLLSYSFLLTGSFVFAAPNINVITEGVAQQGGYDVAGVSDTSLSQTVGNYIKIALSLVGTIFIALTVYAGFLWMTASGEDEKVTKAKDILQAAVIGLVITVSAYSITYFVTGWIFSSQTGPTVVGGDPTTR